MLGIFVRSTSSILKLLLLQNQQMISHIVKNNSTKNRSLIVGIKLRIRDTFLSILLVRGFSAIGQLIFNFYVSCADLFTFALIKIFLIQRLKLFLLFSYFLKQTISFSASETTGFTDMVLLELVDTGSAALKIFIKGKTPHSFLLNGFFFELSDLPFVFLTLLSDLFMHSNFVLYDFQSALRTILQVLLPRSLALLPQSLYFHQLFLLESFILFESLLILCSSFVSQESFMFLLLLDPAALLRSNRLHSKLLLSSLQKSFSIFQQSQSLSIIRQI